MAELYVNVNGTWKQASNYYVNVNGTWKEGNELHAKISSAWKESSASSTYNGTSGIVSTNIVLDLNASISSSYSGSGTTWSDISGNNNDLTLTNGPTFSTDNGGIIVFDGTNDSAISALNQAFFQFGTGDYSYGLWVKLDTQANSSYAGVLSSGQGGETGSWQIDLYYTSKFRHRFKNSSGSVDELATTTLSSFTNTWYYLFVVNDRSEDELKIYVNGVLNATGSSANYGSTSVGVFSSATDTKNVFSVGQNRGHNDFIDGSVAQVHVYKGKALSASEVLQNYLASGGNFFGNIVTTDLVLHLDASNTMSYLGSGTAWNDISGQGNNATLVNSPSYKSNHGGYFVFDGSNDYATLPEIDISGDEVTFTIWNYGTSNQYSFLLYLSGNSANTRVLAISLPYPYPTGTNQIYFDKGTILGYDRINFGATNSEYQGWHHWAFTANASTGSMKIYLDGVLRHSGTGKNTSIATPADGVQRIGANANSYHIGYISQILLYKKELTAAQVLANYNATKSNYVDLITKNLILHLDASNTNSYSGTGTTWNNLVSSSYDATLNNGVSFSSSDGGSLSFDGTNDYAEITSASGLGNFSGDFTIEFWLKRSSHSSYGVVLEHYGGGTQRWCTQQSTNNNNMYLRVDGAFTIETSGATINDNKWHHHVVSRVGSTITYYIDTVSRGTATNSDDVGSSGDTLRIGMFSGGAYTTTGSIPQVRIYSGTGLIASEVTQNYNATKGNFLGAISTTDLVFYLDASKSMSYSGSGTTWTDLSSSSNNGTLTNGPTFDSAHGGSIVFDGTNDRIETGSDMFNPNADFTISAWVNADVFSGTNKYNIVSDYSNTGSFQLAYKNGDGIRITDSTVVELGLFSNSTLSTGVWYNITVTRSSNTYTLYLNGSSTSTVTSSNVFDRGPQTIGSNFHSVAGYWDGKIAQVFAYSSALSASDVLSNYNATKSNYHELITTNLVLHLDASNSSSYSGSGTTWTDLSGNSNNGTLINGPTYSSDNGGSIVFDGSDDKVDINDSSSFVLGSDNFTAEVWVYFDSVSSGSIISKHTTSIPHWFELRIGNSGYIRTQVSLNGTSWGVSYQSTTSVTTNQWYNLTLVRNGSSFKTYINGVDGGGSGSSSSSISNNTSYPFRIGLRGGNDQPLDGRVAVVRLYKGTGFTDSQVIQNYNATKATYGY